MLNSLPLLRLCASVFFALMILVYAGSNSEAQEASDPVALVEQILDKKKLDVDLKTRVLQSVEEVAQSDLVVVPFREMSGNRKKLFRENVEAWVAGIPDEEFQTELQIAAAIDGLEMSLKRVFYLPVYGGDQEQLVASQLDGIEEALAGIAMGRLQLVFPEIAGTDVEVKVREHFGQVLSGYSSADVMPQFKYPLSDVQLSQLKERLQQLGQKIDPKSCVSPILLKRYSEQPAAERLAYLEKNAPTIASRSSTQMTDCLNEISKNYDEVVPGNLRNEYRDAVKNVQSDPELQKSAFKEMTKLQSEWVDKVQAEHKSEFDARVAMLREQGKQNPAQQTVAGANTKRILLGVSGVLLLAAVGLFVIVRKR